MLLVTRAGVGGAAVHVELLLRHLPREHLDVAVAASPLEDPEALERMHDARVHRLPIARNVAPIADFLSFLRLLWILARERPDVIHAHTSKPGMLARVAGRLMGVPRILYTPHGFYFTYHQRGLKRRIFLWLERLLARLGDLTICLSGEEQRAAEEMVAGRSVLLPNAVPALPAATEDERRAMRTEFGLAPDATVITLVGRLAEPKEPAVAIQAMSKLDEGVLVVVGDGPMRAELEQLAARDHAGRVLFTGARPDAARLQAAADVALLASRSEGLPYVLLEAAAAGVARVASDLPGCREVIAHELDGLLVPPGDADALASALKNVMRDPELRRRLGERARARTRQHHSLEKWAHSLARLYGSARQPDRAGGNAGGGA